MNIITAKKRTGFTDKMITYLEGQLKHLKTLKHLPVNAAQQLVIDLAEFKSYRKTPTDTTESADAESADETTANDE